jgi:NAD(P)-dependent dehydrogenase (short-subunit alcohol dehydrogenase family)
MRAIDLTGKVAVVTGGDSGIGRAIAVEFAKHGADLLVTYLHDRAGAEETVRLIEEAGRGGVASHTDQRDPRAVAKLFEEVEAKLGAPFILVNNAGIGGGDGEVAELDPDEWDRVIRTNLYGPFYCCQHFIRARRKAGGKGKIVSSSNAETPLTTGAKPLLTCDVWEHAYYIDYRNKRDTFLEVFCDKLLNWDFVAKNLRG